MIMPMNLRKITFSKLFSSGIVMPLAAGCFLACAVVMAYQGFIWIKTGHWHDVSVTDFFIALCGTDFRAPNIKWHGAQNFLNVYFNTGLALNLMALSVFLTWFAAKDRKDRRR
jgi:hypothetical protein